MRRQSFFVWNQEPQWAFRSAFMAFISGGQPIMSRTLECREQAQWYQQLCSYSKKVHIHMGNLATFTHLNWKASLDIVLRCRLDLMHLNCGSPWKPLRLVLQRGHGRQNRAAPIEIRDWTLHCMLQCRYASGCVVPIKMLFVYKQSWEQAINND